MTAGLDAASTHDIVVVDPVPLFARGLEALAHRWRTEVTVWTRDGLSGARRVGEPAVHGWTLLVLGPGYLSDASLLTALPAGVRVPTLAAVHPRLPVTYAALLERGITSLWDVTSSESAFYAAADAAVRGEEYISPGLSVALVRSVGSRLSQLNVGATTVLTGREREILRMLAEGATNRSIADALFISENTVKNHVHSILDKLQAASRTEAVVLAARAGLVDLGGGSR